MYGRRATRVKGKFSEAECRILDELDIDPSKKLDKFGLVKGRRVSGFQLCFLTPKNIGDSCHIYQRNPADLPALLHQDRNCTGIAKSVWFWIAQLAHFGLYDPSIKHDLRWKTARRCRIILRDKIKSGGLRVPLVLILHEERLRAERTRAIADERRTKQGQASVENNSANNAAPTDLTDKLLPGEGDGDETGHVSDDNSTTTCDLPTQVQGIDDGYSSSIDEQFFEQDTQSETTDDLETNTDEESENDEPILGATLELPEEGRYTVAECQVLHDWRDAFCIQHDMTRAEFQVMMTRSHALGNTCWTYDFITKAEFLEDCLAQLPKRGRTSKYNFRRTHNFDPPGEPELVRNPQAPMSLQRRRPSRLTLIDSEDEEVLDGAEVEILNARAARDTTNWELEATEPLSDVHMIHEAAGDLEEHETANESSDGRQIINARCVSGRSTQRPDTGEGSACGQRVKSRTARSGNHTTPILNHAQDNTKLTTQNGVLNEQANTLGIQL